MGNFWSQRMVKIVSKPEPLRRVDLPKAFGTSSKFNNKDKMVRSAAADREHQSIFHTTSLPTEVGKPAAIRS